MNFALITDMIFGGTSKLPNAKLENIILGDVMKHFEEKRGPGGAWSDLLPETWRRKQTNEMLRETGEYVESIKVETIYSDDKTITQVYSAMPGRKNKIPIYHELGFGDDPNRTRRSFVWLSDPTIVKIQDLLGTFVLETL